MTKENEGLMRKLPSYHVIIDPDGVSDISEKDYEDLVELDLGKIYSATTGRAVFTIIARYGSVLIKPYRGSERCQGGSIGGYGSIQIVEYAPQQYAKGPTSCSAKMGWNADENLCHEIFHAARRLGGDPGHFDSLDGYMESWKDEEEFFAILVANIYSSETGRADHMRLSYGMTKLYKGLRDPEKWLQYKEAHYDLVEKFCEQHPVAAPMMARAKADFNPIRTFYEWQKRNYKPTTWQIQRS